MPFIENKPEESSAVSKKFDELITGVEIFALNERERRLIRAVKER